MADYKNALVGDTVNYIGYKWKVIEVLAQGSRVMHRPWWKLRKIGVVIA